jgi:hypothetical protein
MVDYTHCSWCRCPLTEESWCEQSQRPFCSVECNQAHLEELRDRELLRPSPLSGTERYLQQMKEEGRL